MNTFKYYLFISTFISGFVFPISYSQQSSPTIKSFLKDVSALTIGVNSVLGGALLWETGNAIQDKLISAQTGKSLSNDAQSIWHIITTGNRPNRNLQDDNLPRKVRAIPYAIKASAVASTLMGAYLIKQTLAKKEVSHLFDNVLTEKIEPEYVQPLLSHCDNRTDEAKKKVDKKSAVLRDVARIGLGTLSCLAALKTGSNAIKALHISHSLLGSKLMFISSNESIEKGGVSAASFVFHILPDSVINKAKNYMQARNKESQSSALQKQSAKILPLAAAHAKSVGWTTATLLLASNGLHLLRKGLHLD